MSFGRFWLNADKINTRSAVIISAQILMALYLVEQMPWKLLTFFYFFFKSVINEILYDAFL